MKRYDKVILAVFVVFSVINVIDFIFYDQKIGYVALAIGFSLMAFGTYKDNNHSKLIGAAFVIAGFIAKWFLDYDLF
jgi:hypothetical protein